MAVLLMDTAAPNPWYNAVNAQCTVREQSEPDLVFPSDVSGAGNAPFNVQRDQPIHVQFQWEQNGFFAGADLSLVLEFQIQFLFERWGSGETGPGLDLNAIVPYHIGNGFVYDFASEPSTRIVIPPNTIPVGVYECMALFQVRFKGTIQRYFAGFAKFDAVNVYRATV